MTDVGNATQGATLNQVSRGPCEIFATHDSIEGTHVIRLYLACDEETAAGAVSKQTFKGVWQPGRMSWVKPSAAWMAYRCGWSIHKDKRQTNVLALDVSTEKFEALLLQAMVSSEGKELPKGLKDSPVVVQWDPERAFDPEAIEKKDSPYLRKISGFGGRRGPETRSLQVGLRGEAWLLFFNEPGAVVLRITDVTANFRAAHDALSRGDLEMAKEAIWPRPELRERKYEPSDELRKAIRIVEIDTKKSMP